MMIIQEMIVTMKYYVDDCHYSMGRLHPISSFGGDNAAALHTTLPLSNTLQQYYRLFVDHNDQSEEEIS